MELWIRSQDRKMLRINPELEIFEYGNRKILIIDTKGCTDYNKLKILGTYETKERALEVLDEIQNMLYISISFTNEPYHNADIRVKTEMLCNMVKVYQMPEE